MTIKTTRKIFPIILLNCFLTIMIFPAFSPSVSGVSPTLILCPVATGWGAGAWADGTWTSGNGTRAYDSRMESSFSGDAVVYMTSGGFNSGVTLEPTILINQTLPINNPIISVSAIVIAGSSMNSGWISVYYGNLSPSSSYPWLDAYNYSLSIPWINSTKFASTTNIFGEGSISSEQLTSVPRAFVYGREFDISNAYPWTATILKSLQLYVMWTQNQVTPPFPGWNTPQHPQSAYNYSSNSYNRLVDYVGLVYTYLGNVTSSDTTFQANLYSLIWLLIIFFPSLLMVQIIPSMGYSIGIIIMIIVIGAIDITFLPVTVIGIASVGIMIYKGG